MVITTNIILMRPGDYITMIEPLNEKYAIEYCDKAGIYFGGTFLWLGIKDQYTAIIRTHVDTEVGIGFIEGHFKKSSRIDNLDNLLKD